MNTFFEYKTTIGERLKRHQISIMVTIIIHLLIIIALLLNKMNDFDNRSMSIVFDYSKDFERDKVEKQLQRKELLKEEVDKLMKEAKIGAKIRNVAVNTEDLRTTVLKDSKGINERVYDDAKRLQEKLDASREKIKGMQNQNSDVPVPQKSAEKVSTKLESYKGPSVISYTLENRRAMSLPVPVYKCKNGGDVFVQIEVNQNGYVVSTTIVEAQSSPDACLHEAAKRAADLSRFSASSTAPSKQVGIIVYRFIAQ